MDRMNIRPYLYKGPPTNNTAFSGLQTDASTHVGKAPFQVTDVEMFSFLLSSPCS